MDRGGAQTGGANSLEGRKNQKLSGEESLYSGAVEEVQEAEEGRNHCWLNIFTWVIYFGRFCISDPAK